MKRIDVIEVNVAPFEFEVEPEKGTSFEPACHVTSDSGEHPLRHFRSSSRQTTLAGTAGAHRRRFWARNDDAAASIPKGE
jgi:hypothetical protein